MEVLSMGKAKKALVIYSGGLDSSSVLNMIVKSDWYEKVSALIFNYGQKHGKEIDYAIDFCEKRDINYMLMDAENILHAGNHFNNIEHKAYKDIEGTPSTWVPNRNNLFVNIAVAVGIADKEPVDIYIGTHKGDNMYPDTTPDWLSSLRENLTLSTNGLARLYAPFWDATKAEVIKFGGLTRDEIDETWSCYEGGNTPCHECATCRERDDAIKIVFGE